MALFKLPHVGNIDNEALDEYYEASIDFNGTDLQIDLNFAANKIELSRLELVRHFIDNLRIHDINNRKYIEKDYSDDVGDVVKTYLQHHAEELGENELATLVSPGSKPATYEKQLLKKLHLVRVGIYPEGEDQFAIFDYSLSRALTDYLVVLFTDENGNIEYITMER